MGVAAANSFQVLEFELAGDQYCVALDHVDEIVNNEDAITEVPNSDPEVVGVMDLRGRTTTIVDPRRSLDLSETADAKYVIVFESDDRPIGWLIEDVTRVADIAESDFDDTTAAGPVNGVFRNDDAFTVWLDPEKIND